MLHILHHKVSKNVICALTCLQIVEEEALIKNNNTCKDFLIEALKYHLLPADQRHLIKTDRTRPRTPISIPKVPENAQVHIGSKLLHVCFSTLACARVQVMIVVGGQAPKAIRSVECYDFQEDRWYQVADLPSRRCRAGRPASPICYFFLMMSSGRPEHLSFVKVIVLA